MLKNQLLRHNSSYAPHNRVKHDKTMVYCWGFIKMENFSPLTMIFFISFVSLLEQIFPFFHNLAYSFFPGNCNFYN